MRSAASAAAALRNAGAQVEQIEFDVGDGRAPYQIWRGFWMVGQQYERLAQIERSAPISRAMWRRD